MPDFTGCHAALDGFKVRYSERMHFRPNPGAYTGTNAENMPERQLPEDPNILRSNVGKGM